MLVSYGFSGLALADCSRELLRSLPNFRNSQITLLARLRNDVLKDECVALVVDRHPGEVCVLAGQEHVRIGNEAHEVAGELDLEGRSGRGH